MAQKQLNHIFFENSLKSMQIFQILMGGMNFRERLQKNQTSSAVRSDFANKEMARKTIVTNYLKIMGNLNYVL